MRVDRFDGRLKFISKALEGVRPGEKRGGKRRERFAAIAIRKIKGSVP